MADAEGGVAELKNEHGMHRARCRGTSLFHVQLLLASSALNLKRLTARGIAGDNEAATPAQGQRIAEKTGQDVRHEHVGATDTITADAWTLTLSMN